MTAPCDSVGSVEPSPSCPQALLPQQATRSSSEIAHAWWKPTAIAFAWMGGPRGGPASSSVEPPLPLSPPVPGSAPAVPPVSDGCALVSESQALKKRPAQRIAPKSAARRLLGFEKTSPPMGVAKCMLHATLRSPQEPRRGRICVTCD